MPKGIPNNPVNPEKPTEKPTYQAFSVQRRVGGWVCVTYYIKNGQVIKTESTEPDVFICAQEHFKKANVHYWNSQR